MRSLGTTSNPLLSISLVGLIISITCVVLLLSSSSYLRGPAGSQATYENLTQSDEVLPLEFWKAEFFLCGILKQRDAIHRPTDDCGRASGSQGGGRASLAALAPDSPQRGSVHPDLSLRGQHPVSLGWEGMAKGQQKAAPDVILFSYSLSEADRGWLLERQQQEEKKNPNQVPMVSFVLPEGIRDHVAIRLGGNTNPVPSAAAGLGNRTPVVAALPIASLLASGELQMEWEVISWDVFGQLEFVPALVEMDSSLRYGTIRESFVVGVQAVDWVIYLTAALLGVMFIYFKRHSYLALASFCIALSAGIDFELQRYPDPNGWMAALGAGPQSMFLIDSVFVLFQSLFLVAFILQFSSYWLRADQHRWLDEPSIAQQKKEAQRVRRALQADNVTLKALVAALALGLAVAVFFVISQQEVVEKAQWPLVVNDHMRLTLPFVTLGCCLLWLLFQFRRGGTFERRRRLRPASHNQRVLSILVLLFLFVGLACDAWFAWSGAQEFAQQSVSPVDLTNIVPSVMLLAITLVDMKFMTLTGIVQSNRKRQQEQISGQLRKALAKADLEEAGGGPVESGASVAERGFDTTEDLLSSVSNAALHRFHHSVRELLELKVTEMYGEFLDEINGAFRLFHCCTIDESYEVTCEVKEQKDTTFFSEVSSQSLALPQSSRFRSSPEQTILARQDGANTFLILRLRHTSALSRAERANLELLVDSLAAHHLDKVNRNYNIATGVSSLCKKSSVENPSLLAAGSQVQYTDMMLCQVDIANWSPISRILNNVQAGLGVSFLSRVFSEMARRISQEQVKIRKLTDAGDSEYYGFYNTAAAFPCFKNMERQHKELCATALSRLKAAELTPEAKEEILSFFDLRFSFARGTVSEVLSVRSPVDRRPVIGSDEINQLGRFDQLVKELSSKMIGNEEAYEAMPEAIQSDFGFAGKFLVRGASEGQNLYVETEEWRVSGHFDAIQETLREFYELPQKCGVGNWERLKQELVRLRRKLTSLHVVRPLKIFSFYGQRVLDLEETIAWLEKDAASRELVEKPLEAVNDSAQGKKEDWLAVEYVGVQESITQGQLQMLQDLGLFLWTGTLRFDGK